MGPGHYIIDVSTPARDHTHFTFPSYSTRSFNAPSLISTLTSSLFTFPTPHPYLFPFIPDLPRSDHPLISPSTVQATHSHFTFDLNDLPFILRTNPLFSTHSQTRQPLNQRNALPSTLDPYSTNSTTLFVPRGTIFAVATIIRQSFTA